MTRQVVEESSVQGIGGFITFGISYTINTRPLSQDMERQSKSLLEDHCGLDIPFTKTLITAPDSLLFMTITMAT